jgi:radical SAM family uncharacterized protein
VKELQDPRFRLLSQVKRPARYIGSEIETLSPKELGSDSVTVCLAFPDAYELGMSYLGFQIFYRLIKSIPFADVDRVYAPWPDMEKLLRAEGLPLCSSEWGLSLKAFDVLAFTLQYELTATNILTMLALGEIPLHSDERRDEDPIVIAGGPGAFVPEPLAPFIDAFCVGDGEVLFPPLLELLRGTKGMRRDERLKLIAGLAGFYVPGVIPVVPSSVKRQIVMDLEKAFYPDSMLVPLSGIVHDRASVEVFRGCTQGCRFCQAGMAYRPVRSRSPEKVLALCKSLLRSTGWEELGLLSLSTCDYRGLLSVLDGLFPLMQEGIKLSLPSLRMDRFSVELASRLETARRGGLTFAPEAGSQRLRNVINKKITDENIKETLETAFSHGWERVKLYFMMGLPTEEEEDLMGIVKLANEALRIGKANKKRAEISVSVAGFMPKPHTPFQWEGQLPRDELLERGRWLKARSKKPGIALSYHDPDQSFIEAVIARGDRRVAEAIEEAWQRGARFDGWTETFSFSLWADAFEACGLDAASIAQRKRGVEEVLPWDHIDVGVDKAFLLSERDRAYAGSISPDCRVGACLSCGWHLKGCRGGNSDCPGRV